MIWLCRTQIKQLGHVENFRGYKQLLSNQIETNQDISINGFWNKNYLQTLCEQ